MKKVKITIEGVTPLLMNSPKGMLEASEGMTTKTAKRNIKEEAEKLAYKTEKGELYIPAEAIKGSLVNASAYKKFGKYSARPMLAGGVRISPHEIGLGVKDYQHDIRTVVIQKARVVKCRPKLNKWKASFEIHYDETLIPDDVLIKPILEEAGKRVGLLDFRPQKLGEFGTFKITEWKPVK